MNMQHTVIPSWYQREGYIKAMANLIEKELQNFDSPEQVHPWNLTLFFVHFWYIVISLLYMLLMVDCLMFIIFTICILSDRDSLFVIRI